MRLPELSELARLVHVALRGGMREVSIVADGKEVAALISVDHRCCLWLMAEKFNFALHG